MMGMVGGKWSFNDFSPMGSIPSSLYLTMYSGGYADFMATPLEDLAKQVKNGTLRIKVGKVFGFNDIAEAYCIMENNMAGGKIVVLS